MDLVYFFNILNAEPTKVAVGQMHFPFFFLHQNAAGLFTGLVSTSSLGGARVLSFFFQSVGIASVSPSSLVKGLTYFAI